MSAAIARIMVGTLITVSATLAQTEPQDEADETTKLLEFDLTGMLQQREDPDKPTAEELLRALRSRRPANAMIPPIGGTTTADPIDTLLRPEGTAVVSSEGSIRHQEGWWLFVPKSNEREPSIKLLPNAVLEVMVRASDTDGAPVRFVVSGETTVYRDENYLFARVVRRVVERQPSNDRAQEATPKAAADMASAESTDRATLVDASAEDVLAAMQRQALPESVMPTLSPVAPRLSGGRSLANLLPDGSPMVRRAGRLVRDGDWWTFAFESDSIDFPEWPLKLLPGRTLETMVQSDQFDSGGNVLIVSGEITTFDGENYLLPTLAVKRVAMGNFQR